VDAADRKDDGNGVGEDEGEGEGEGEEEGGRDAEDDCVPVDAIRRLLLPFEVPPLDFIGTELP
jgi:hypothetical protein